MKKLVALLFAAALTCSLAFAQTETKPADTKKEAATTEKKEAKKGKKAEKKEAKKEAKEAKKDTKETKETKETK